ncbi:hypothetical protein SAMN05421819_1115 [Bryocella elongata]|uniref:Adenylate cyclase n=1 Tax=Bryocella elongata TaxID=863522 RepID=A0A1H5UQM7_9BACT|nr:hypothetical protein [Bryocella elongata]SEF76748.1 hypothetical protein SAMN05421819_1115 [Bryocella elongata]
MLTDTLRSGSPYTDEEKVAVEEQLERLLANPYFSHSRRFPSFLRYVTEHTLAGEADQLKERTLGIEIFGKPPTYDTATDPIVRVTAAEIRKRIAQYYQDPGHSHELRVSLPPGSYVPVFTPAHPEVEAVASLSADVEEAPSTSPGSEIDGLPEARRVTASMRSRSILLGGLILAAGLLALAGSGLWRMWVGSSATAEAEFWRPVLNSADPVLICIADQTQYSAITLRDAQDPSRQVTLKDNLTAVVIDDVSPIAKIAGVLEASHKHYSLLGEGVTTLSQLRSGPSVMVGAFDNTWTLRLLAPLRFHFANDPAMNTFSIVDTQSPTQQRWVVHRSQQLATNNYRDYAIVARFTDVTTGKPTVVAAGIGRGGTISAGEFVTNEELLRTALARIPNRRNSNLEVVLSADIIDGEPGTPKVEAVYFW